MALAANALAARAFRTLTTARMSASSAPPRRSAAGGLVAVVYVSEGKSQGVVDALETVARDVCATHGAQVVNVFRDVEYNRTGFTLGARVPPSASIDDAHPTTVEPLRSVAVALAERALSLVDLRSHAAAHPRCGVVDHISCHAIGEVDESLAAALARGIGERVGTFGVPALLYGSASARRASPSPICAEGTDTFEKLAERGLGPARTSWKAVTWTRITALGWFPPPRGW